MKRSLIATATTLALASIMLAGCGQSPATSALPSRVSQSQMRPATPTTQAPAYGNPAPVLGNNAAGVGAVVLQLSSLGGAYQVQATREDVAEIEVKMTGAGLTQPLIKRMSKGELQTSTTVAFEGVPVGAYSIALAAFDTEGLNIGQKSTSVQVQADQETEVKLQLKLNPTLASGNVKFDFDIVDGDLITDPTPTPDEEEQTDEPEMDTEGMLDVEIVSMDTVRKLLLLKKLEVTLKITNTNTTEHLSGEVKVDFFKMKGFFNKEETLVETLTEEVDNLAPGKSVTITLTSSKSASDAEATVHTIASSATASSR